MGDEGTIALGGCLENNTTITQLNLEGCHCHSSVSCDCFIITSAWTECHIGNEGAIALGQMLKVNTTLTALNLRGVRWIWKKKDSVNWLVIDDNTMRTWQITKSNTTARLHWVKPWSETPLSLFLICIVCRYLVNTIEQTDHWFIW